MVLAGLLEMLLPENQMKKFIKVIMGLFVIVALLGPVSSLMEDEPSWELSSWSLPSSEGQGAATVLSTGQMTDERFRGRIMNEYQSHLGRQIESLVNLVPGVERSEAKVSLRSGTTIYSLDAISKVEIKVLPEKGGGEITDSGIEKPEERGSIQVVVPPVNAVKVNPYQGSQTISNPTGDADALSKRVKEMVANFYGLPRENVLVEVL